MNEINLKGRRAVITGGAQESVAQSLWDRDRGLVSPAYCESRCWVELMGALRRR